MSRTAQVQLCHEPGQAGDKLRLRSWIEVQLLGEDDSPIPDEAYEIRLPGGTLLTGTLDENGSMRIDDIPPGTCQVSFPNLDKEAWVPIEATAKQETTATAKGQAA
jgi:hypothetical protein